MFTIVKFVWKWGVGGIFPGANLLISVVAIVGALSGLWYHGYSTGRDAQAIKDLKAKIAALEFTIAVRKELDAYSVEIATEWADAEASNEKVSEGIDDEIARLPDRPGNFSSEFLNGLRNLK